MTKQEALEHALATSTPLLLGEYKAEFLVFVPFSGGVILSYANGNAGMGWVDTWFNIIHDQNYELLDWFYGANLCHCPTHELMVRGCVCGGK